MNNNKKFLYSVLLSSRSFQSVDEVITYETPGEDYLDIDRPVVSESLNIFGDSQEQISDTRE